MSYTKRSCDEMRLRMLEADIAELRGEGDSPVALHLRDCRTCAAAGLRILDAQQELADVLETLVAAAVSPPAATRASAGLPGSASPSGLTVPRSTSENRARRFRRRVIGASASLAAAAVLVLFLLSRDGELPRLATQPPLNAVAMSSTPVVNVEAGSDVAVMQTSNPNITVVWYLNRERQ